jgi:hypothetical protein
MGDPKPKTATVSVPPKATVNIKVRFKVGNGPVVGALGFSTRPGEGARNLGKTNALGQLRNVKFDPGQVDIVLVFKNHRGEGMPQAVDTNPNSTLVFSGVLTAGTRDIDVVLVQVASQVTVTVVDSISGLPLAGTKVTTGAFSGSGNGKGVVVTDGLATGLFHTITAVHAGFGPAGGTVEGPVSGTVDLRKVSAVTNSALELKMKPIFGKVKSSNITVEGKSFPAFYLEDFVPTFPEHHPTITIQGQPQLSFPARDRRFFNRGQFDELFDDIPRWAGAPEITIEEFVSSFLIFANETGGAFKPIAERGNLAHMFYLNNKGGNRGAGDQLRDRGIISEQATIDAWNATGRINPRTNQCDNFPGTSPSGPTDADVTECDFNKYRGRGFVQLTNLPNYQTFLDPSLAAAGLADSEHLTSAQLDDAVLNNETVYYGTLGAYLKRVRNSWGLTNSEQWRQWGLTVAGQNNTGYGDLFQFRAEKLFARLMTAARAGQLELK